MSNKTYETIGHAVIYMVAAIGFALFVYRMWSGTNPGDPIQF